MINKKIVLVIFLFVISLGFVNAIEIIENIEGYEFVNSRPSNSQDFAPTYNIRYIDQSTDSRYFVQLSEFNDKTFSSEYLDIWITPKVQRNRGLFDYSGNIVFIDERNSSVFWRSGSVFVKVSAKIRYVSSEEESEFPTGIIERYLEVYPSDCDEKGCVIEKEKSFEEIYTFDEPENLQWKAMRHFDRSFFCPQNLTIQNIREKMQRGGTFFNDIVAGDELTKFLDECRQGGFFNFKGRPFSPEIEECFNNLSTFFTEIDLYSTHSGIRKDIVKECYIRDYFNQRFNPNTIQNYDKNKFDALLDNRTNEFIDFVRLKINYPKPRVLEEKSAEITGSEDTSGRDIINISCRPEFGNECTTQNISLVNESESAINDPESEVPTKNILEQIKTKIKSFFRWFI